MQMPDKIVLRSVESLIPYARNALTYSDHTLMTEPIVAARYMLDVAAVNGAATLDRQSEAVTAADQDRSQPARPPASA